MCSSFRPVYCPNLTEPNNGSIEVTGLTAGSNATYTEVTGLSAGSNATYTCEFPFELLDNATDVRTCEPDGNWSLPEPQCIGMIEPCPCIHYY